MNKKLNNCMHYVSLFATYCFVYTIMTTLIYFIVKNPMKAAIVSIGLLIYMVKKDIIKIDSAWEKL